MKTLYIHPDNPQSRFVDEVVSTLSSGGIVILPTEHGYRFSFGMNAKDACERLKRLGIEQHDFMLICQNISQLSEVAVVTNDTFHTLKNDFLPQNAFVLEPTKAVNKKIIDKKSLTFGTSTTPLMTAVLMQLNEPLFIAPLLYQGEVIHEHYDITDKLDSQADIFVDVGVIDDKHVNAIDLT